MRLRTFLEDTKILLIELTSFGGGLIWFSKSKSFEYEPLILVGISAIGLISFCVLKFIHNHDDRPIIELEIISNSIRRSSYEFIPNVSPRNDEGDYLIMSEGIYRFEVEYYFKLIIRNNSTTNAYNLTIFKSANLHFSFFGESFSPLEPLSPNNTRVIDIHYFTVKDIAMNDNEYAQKSSINDIKTELSIIAQYQNDRRDTYYTLFGKLMENTQQTKVPNLKKYTKIETLNLYNQKFS